MKFVKLCTCCLINIFSLLLPGFYRRISWWGRGGGVMMEECLLPTPAVLAHDPQPLKILHQEVDEAI